MTVLFVQVRYGKEILKKLTKVRTALLKLWAFFIYLVMRLQLRTGDVYKTNQGCDIEIVSFESKRSVTVSFDNGHKATTTFQNIVKGQLKNPFLPIVAGVGFIGYGSETAFINGKDTKAYVKWVSMLNRCYRKPVKATYEDCSVCDYWHNFQNFSVWFKENYIESFELDKDILVRGNRIYSPETCCFVPREVNLLFTKRQNKRGVYPIGVSLHKEGKFASQISLGNGKSKSLGLYITIEGAFLRYKYEKECFIKSVAEKHKPYITPKVYEALINHEIKITDYCAHTQTNKKA